MPTHLLHVSLPAPVAACPAQLLANAAIPPLEREQFLSLTLAVRQLADARSHTARLPGQKEERRAFLAALTLQVSRASPQQVTTDVVRARALVQLQCSLVSATRCPRTRCMCACVSKCPVLQKAPARARHPNLPMAALCLQ